MFSFLKRNKGKSTSRPKLSDFNEAMSRADDVFDLLPIRLQMEVDRISLGLPEYGPRKLMRKGPGMDFFEAREFMPDLDDPRKINARLSARMDTPMVIDKEAEIRQHFYLWRDSSPSMEFASHDAPYSKKEAAEIMMLALAKHLAKNEEMIGILDRPGSYRGGHASDIMAEHLADHTVLSADMPFVERELPKHSNAILFSDFMTDPEVIREGLSHLEGIDLKGALVFVLDPLEIEFAYEGHIEFEGAEGEGEMKFKKAETKKDQFQEALADHINKIKEIAAEKNFEVIVQRTDEPLENALYILYGLDNHKPVKGLKPALNL